MIKSQFIDVTKIISYVDPEKALEFKKRNAAAQAEHSHSHDDHDHHGHDHHGHDHHGHSHAGHSCGNQNKIYIKISDMNSVEKVINSILTSRTFFKNNLK